MFEKKMNFQKESRDEGKIQQKLQSYPARKTGQMSGKKK
jgi:hypothetical protein